MTDQTGMDFGAAQAEMRHAYFSGATGMLTSATAWAVAAIATVQMSPQRAIWVLFIGGMLIHPVSTVINKALGRPASHSKENPLGALALATTFWMIMCLPLAYGVGQLRIEWFFPAMLLVIGGRYLTFSTLFGMRIYWICGLALAGAGYFLGRMAMSPTVGAAAGAAIEAGFAVAVIVLARSEAPSRTALQA